MIHRRQFLQSSSLAFLAPSLLTQTSNAILPPTVIPISVEERKQRIAKAQRLLVKNNMRALILDAGTSMEYFTGVKWYPSERSLLAIIPDKGDLSFICPAFEEDRFSEINVISQQVRTWEEHENPFAMTIQLLKDQGIRTGKLAIEERTRFFIFDGLRKAGPSFQLVSGDPISIPCRMIKSPTEIALMQRANDITVEAIKAGIASLKEGMTPADVSSKIAQVHRSLGAVHDFALVNMGVATSFPHGSNKPQILKQGEVVLLDVGCVVGGYSSDITRTIVFGQANDQQKKIWDLEKKSQAAGFAAAQLGRPCEEVDRASRKVLEDAGFGPGYRLPGLPHRTGHGIGMNGHEWGNMVKGNKDPLQVGMCFSIEPTIAIPGEFGIRLEDCVYMTEDGPRWFSQPSPSINKPFQ
ncbi:M24 family metallopeptidase [Aquirufa aurantiipilula]|uniref:Xaa-Pro peptidase family protein n=1 Tax=Aquirufa aurantiipilula TaxID=2696561 RepID=A0ABT6BMG0_9BACT|nr:Xaa-Pro peptidase family protein [Aquirufa aurantiipilula]MDF5691659.1 Xaa-Pro peptidase family protein [Aquirufa aurantiipilula]